MGKGIDKNAKARQAALDDLVKPYWDKGFTCKEIAFYLNVSVQAVGYSIKRLKQGYTQQRTTSAEHEAQLLIDAKLAPTVTPKAHKIMVNGWENGRYIHRQMVDVSEFWGL